MLIILLLLYGTTVVALALRIDIDTPVSMRCTTTPVVLYCTVCTTTRYYCVIHFGEVRRLWSSTGFGLCQTSKSCHIDSKPTFLQQATFKTSTSPCVHACVHPSLSLYLSLFLLPHLDMSPLLAFFFEAAEVRRPRF